MKLLSINALIAAIEEGSLRGAARRIGVSQPACTRMIRELEAELSASLLQRSTTGVLATAQGQVLYERALAARRELDEAVQQIEQLGGRMQGELSIGAVPLAVLLLIPETLRTFSHEFPDIHLRVREELYMAQLTLLRTGEVDIALGPIPEGLPAGEFHIEPLMPIRMAVVTGRRSRWTRCRSLAELAQAKWVYTSMSGATGYARQLFQHHGLQAPPAAAVVNSTLGLLSLIANGDHVGLMPTQIATHPAAAPFMQVVSIEEGHLDLTIGAMVRSTTLLKPALRHFMAHLHRAAHQLEQDSARSLA
jgi:LysR family transcriptional regulator of abg operon